MERTPGFTTPAVVPGVKRGHPTSDSGSTDSNSPKRLKLVLSPSSRPEEAPCAVDSGVCLQPDTRCKSKEEAVSTDPGQSPVLRGSRKRRASQSDATDEAPIPGSGTRKRALVSSPEIVLQHCNPKTPCSQATTISVTPRKEVISPVSSILYQPSPAASRRKSIRHLARKLKNNDVSPDADWKKEQRHAFQLSQAIGLSSSFQCTPTQSVPSSAQPSPQSGLGSLSCGQSGVTVAEEVEANSSRRQMPARRCKNKSPTVAVITPRSSRRTRKH